MKKSVLRIAAVVLFALVIFINVSHGHVKAFQGNKDSEAAEATNAIEGDGVLAISTGDEAYISPTIENIEHLGAGAGAPTIASTEAVELAEADLTPVKSETVADKTSSKSDIEPAIREESKESVAAADVDTEENNNLENTDNTDMEENLDESADIEASEAATTDVLAGRSEPKTAGKDIPIVLFAIFALFADFFLVLIENAHGMNENDKTLAIKKIKSHVRPNDKFSHIKAYVEVFMLLLYYHLIGKYIKQNKNYA